MLKSSLCMDELKLGYVPLAKQSWLDERVNSVFTDSVCELRKLNVELVQPEKVVTTDEEASGFANTLKEKQIDALLVHFITFSLGSIIPILTNELDVPVILWSMPEPPMRGGRLSSNSFCAANMNVHFLWKMKRKYQFMFGEFEDISEFLSRSLSVINCTRILRSVKIGLIGYRVPGFYTSNFNELAIRKVFGTEVKQIDLLEIVEEAKNADMKTGLTEIKKTAASVNQLTEDELEKGERLYLAFKSIAKKYGIHGLAVKCWPEFGDIYGIGCCSTLGRLTDEGIICSCEGDMYGAVLMMINSILSGEAPFFGDLISFNEEENTGLIWHCGAAAQSLCGNFSETQLCRHSIMDGGGVKGVTNEFPLKPGLITFARLGENNNGGYRMLIATGEGLPTKQLLRGNPLNIRFDGKVSDLVNTIINQGFEHHYVLVHKNIKAELIEFCKWLDIEVIMG